MKETFVKNQLKERMLDYLGSDWEDYDPSEARGTRAPEPGRGFWIRNEADGVIIHVNVIGFNGPPNAGKDTLAERIVTYFNSMKFTNREGEPKTCFAQKISFADALKEGCAAFFGINLEDFHDRSKKELNHRFWGISPRRMAQLVGTEAMRNNFSKTVWVNRVQWEIIRTMFGGHSSLIHEKIQTSREYQKETPEIIQFVCLIPDVRFEDEAVFIHDSNGFVVHIRTERETTTEHMDHASERGITFSNEYDTMIDNRATLLEFLDQGVHVIRERIR